MSSPGCGQAVQKALANLTRDTAGESRVGKQRRGLQRVSIREFAGERQERRWWPEGTA